MIHEDITISGSFQASGSFILPRIPSNSLATATTGSMFYDTVNDVVKIYTGTGSTTDGYVTVGAQSEPPGPSTGADIEYLAIAGGGSGGSDYGGGGGAGGYQSSSLSDVESGSSFTITIGAGGASVTGGNNDGENGSDTTIAGSTISTITAIGGGGGGAEGNLDGKDGGSGGGGAFSGATAGTGGSGTVGQGNDGGDGQGSGGQYLEGGGGGAGTAGEDAVANTSNGDGGDGLASSITGTSVTRAGGGGAGFSSDYNKAGASGGTGGGGDGGTTREGHGTAGTDNTGAGGGGAGGYNTTANSGAGGSGVAIFAYPTGSITATGGIKTTRADGQFVHTFKESGTLTVGGADFHTIAPSENFNIVTFTGNGSSGNSITGVGFQPDFVWLKSRSGAVGDFSHTLMDSTRGASKSLSSNNTNAEVTNTNGLESFDTDGFTVGSAAGGWNYNGTNYVGWCWKAGGATGSNDDGSITSYVSANQAAGFSILKYNMNLTSGTFTIGHGLNSAPELVIFKTLGTSNSSWIVYPNDNSQILVLDSTGAASAGSSYWNSASPTSTVINMGTGWTSNHTYYAGDTIAYCFHSVDGYQKIGSYSGNGTNQTITTGFRPAWIMIKATTGTSAYKSWVIFDTQRATAYNDTNLLYANKDAAEGARGNGSGDGDVLEIITTATGFKLGDASRNNASDEMNDGSTTYLYWAISE